MELLPQLLRGASITVQVTFYSALLTFFIAFIAGLSRLSKNYLVRKATGVYVEIFRGTSLLVQLFWIYFVLPFFGLELSALAAGVIALGMNYGAYASEIVRGSVLAIPKAQTEATIALNMSRWQRMRRIIIPQAFKLMLPGFGNISIELLKGTSLVYFINLADLTNQSMLMRNTNNGQTFEIFTLLLIVYFVLALPLILTARWLERRSSVGRV